MCIRALVSHSLFPLMNGSVSLKVSHMQKLESDDLDEQGEDQENVIPTGLRCTDTCDVDADVDVETFSKPNDALPSSDTILPKDRSDQPDVASKTLNGGISHVNKGSEDDSQTRRYLQGLVSNTS